jgi:hypothetical protein
LETKDIFVALHLQSLLTQPRDKKRTGFAGLFFPARFGSFSCAPDSNNSGAKQNEA